MKLGFVPQLLPCRDVTDGLLSFRQRLQLLLGSSHHLQILITSPPHPTPALFKVRGRQSMWQLVTSPGSALTLSGFSTSLVPLSEIIPLLNSP